MNPNQRIAVMAVLVLILISACKPFPEEDLLRSFPAGYIDSPYVVPDGSALYFLHSAVSTIDMLQGNPSAKPVTAFLPGHQGQNGAYWWNTDIYVAFKNPDGTWGTPQNLGPTINSEHLEGGPWTNAEQTVLIFQRESVTDPSLSGAFISRREGKDKPWGEPERLPGGLGTFGTAGFADIHMAPSGNLYFGSEDNGQEAGNGTLYWARSIGTNQWSAAELLPESFQSALDESQPWVNDDETMLCFNRREANGNTQLWCATRENSLTEWGIPTLIPLVGFADANGSEVWGEPSFTNDGTMFFVRFDTSTKEWNAEPMSSVRGEDGSYMTPQKLVFENEQ